MALILYHSSLNLHLINTNFRVNNYFMNLFYLKKQPLDIDIEIDIVYSATCLHVTLYIYTYTIKYVTYNIS